MGRRVQELLVQLGADIPVGAAAGGDDFGQGAAGGEVGVVGKVVGSGHLARPVPRGGGELDIYRHRSCPRRGPGLVGQLRHAPLNGDDRRAGRSLRGHR